MSAKPRLRTSLPATGEPAGTKEEVEPLLAHPQGDTFAALQRLRTQHPDHAEHDADQDETWVYAED